MASTLAKPPAIPGELVDALQSMPLERAVEHCGKRWSVSPFDVYSKCPACGSTIKLRAFSGGTEFEDVFDAVFEWMNQSPQANRLAEQRRQELMAEDAD